VILKHQDKDIMSDATSEPATEEQLLCIGAVHEPDFSFDAMSTDLLLAKVLTRTIRNDSHDAEADAGKSLRLRDVLAATSATATACSYMGAALTSTAEARKSSRTLDHTPVVESSRGIGPKEEWVVLELK